MVSLPVTVTCTAGLSDKSIKWVTSFPQALKSEIVSNDIVKNSGSHLGNAFSMQSEYYDGFPPSERSPTEGYQGDDGVAV